MGSMDLNLFPKASVLLVEDEADVRSMISTALSELGCTVKAFPDAEQALLYAMGCQLDLLVTDAVLPGATGLTLARQIMEIQPEVEVMVISAYLPQNADLLDSKWHCIAKPFSTDRLKRTVRRALHESRYGSSQTKS